MFDYSTMPNRDIVCVDMKSFYASCSCIMLGLDPLTAHLAVVGNLERNGSVVLASSPAMKRDFQIKTGNRLFEIPNDKRIILVEPKMDTYLAVSTAILRIFNRYAPKHQIHVYSVDEAFIDLSGGEKLFGTVVEVSKMIRDDMLREFGLTCCVGIGPNILLAKVCLDVEAKKTGIAKWTYADVPTKLWSISPLSKMWGIGSRMEKRLNALGIYSVGELAAYDLKKLEQQFGVMGNQLYQHAWGIDNAKIGHNSPPKTHGIGQGQTLMRDYTDVSELKTLILEMCENVAQKARRGNYVTRTISLSLSFSKNHLSKSFNHAKTIDQPTNITMAIYKVCEELFDQYYVLGAPVRKIQIRIANLEKDDGEQQLSFFEPYDQKQKNVGFVMDAIKEKMGRNAILRAASLTKGATARQRSELIGGHKA